MRSAAPPPWLSLLLRPYENLLGSKSVWDLRMPDGTAVRIERASQALNNLLYRVRIRDEVFGCKLFVADERQRVEREWTALKLRQPAEPPHAPRPIALAIDGPLPQPVLVFQWVEAVPFFSQTPSPGDLALLVDALARVHGTSAPPDQTVLPAWHQPPSFAAYLAEIETAVTRVRQWAANRPSMRTGLPAWAADLPALLPLLDESLTLATQAVTGSALDGSRWTPALIRADGNLDNMARTPDGEVIFTDWGLSGLGDAAFDLAELCWHPRSLLLTPVGWQAALAGYRPDPVDAGFARRLAVYMRLLPAWWVGRTALHLIEGIEKGGARSRGSAVPLRMYGAVRKQLDRYLAALGLLELPHADEDDEVE